MGPRSPGTITFWRAVMFWRLGPGNLVLYAAIFVALGVGFYLIQQNQTGDLRAAAAGECYRVNVLRQDVNVTTYTFRRALLTSTAGAGRPISPAARRLFAEFRRFALALRRLPLTDCRQAVGRPTRYRPPPAVPFPPGWRPAPVPPPP